MRDGAIIADEPTAIGQVASRAMKSMYTIPKKTAEDDLAGFSTIMRAVPQLDSAPRTAAKYRRRKTLKSRAIRK